MLGDDAEFRIKLAVDPKARTITVTDNGIGMTRAEVEDNIGTIANSGTRRFLEELRKGQVAGTPELIGQFGVGFYSTFMVADHVTVVTRKAGEPAESATHWESTGDGSYTVEEATRPGRGTDVTLHLREGMDEYLEEWRLRSIVKHYSDYIAYPIQMDVTHEEPAKDADGKEQKDAKPVSVTRTETLNSMKAIWRRARTEVKDEDYHEFYRHVSHDVVEPLRTIHFRGEGATEFHALLFLPKHAPWDLHFQREHRGVHLYVKNVFITDNCRELLPDYLGFVRGVVDSSDLPLNVSREILQDDAIIRRIHKSLVGKVLGTLAEMREKTPNDYDVFYREFGALLKTGIHQDFTHQDKIKDLLLFESSKTRAGHFVSLKDYVARLPAGQPAIYYLCAEDRRAGDNSPHLEVFRKKDYEVLYFLDPIDDFLAQELGEYEKKKFVAVDRGEVQLSDAEEKKTEETARAAAAETYKDLLAAIKDRLHDEVKDVRFSTRLTDSACCLVADEHGPTPRMARFYKSMKQEMMPVPRILELNPNHALIKVLQGLYAQDAKHPRLDDFTLLLYDQALLAEGTPLKEPLRFAKLVSELMVAQGVAPAASAPAGSAT